MKGRILATALCAAWLPACVTSTQATRLQRDLDDVKRQLHQVLQDTTGSRARMEEVAGRMSEPAAPSSAQADLQAAVQSLLDRVQALSEKIESLTQEIRSLRETGRRSAAPPAGDRPFPGPATGSPAGSAASAPAAPAAEQIFSSAYADYSKGNYELAIMGFSEFLKAYPGHPRTADAQYWIGECQYSQGKFREAVEAFDVVLSRHAGSEKTPAALLKKGYAQIEAGQTTQAVSTLQRLIDGHPHTDEARLAGERLRQMGLRG